LPPPTPAAATSTKPATLGARGNGKKKK
jgi:hypothetical protein